MAPVELHGTVRQHRDRLHVTLLDAQEQLKGPDAMDGGSGPGSVELSALGRTITPAVAMKCDKTKMTLRPQQEKVKGEKTRVTLQEGQRIMTK